MPQSKASDSMGDGKTKTQFYKTQSPASSLWTDRTAAVALPPSHRRLHNVSVNKQDLRYVNIGAQDQGRTEQNVSAQHLAMLCSKMHT
jgi:hypothetical protein